MVWHYASGNSTVAEVLLCGYSAGSLSASTCAPLPEPCKTRYLLISYPLSVLWALTLFRSSYFTDALQTRIKHASTAPILSIRGTRDQFTGDKAYKAWESTSLLGASPDARSAKFVAIDSADHFWSNPGSKMEMLGAADDWL